MDRLNKYLAHAGVASRRQCDVLIRAGRISIDGEVVKDLATRVSPEQDVRLDGKSVTTEKFVYYLVNKPRGYLCTNHDPARRPLVIDLVPQIEQRVYTVGRLDEDSEGLLLLTNDGDLANRLMHPRYGVEKTYLVQVAGTPSVEDLAKLLEGVWLSDGHVKVKSLKRLRRQGESTWLRIVLAEGKNREIRRMLAKLLHKVIRLKRVAIGMVELGSLATRKSRPLSPRELRNLQRIAARNVPADDEPDGDDPDGDDS
ncbi:MAG: rRNA pseudouridine synthase [Gemmataceae bacterium]|nr:rRNA pseudouridine synthase [Gemmataceae bacterium]